MTIHRSKPVLPSSLIPGDLVVVVDTAAMEFPHSAAVMRHLCKGAFGSIQMEGEKCYLQMDQRMPSAIRVHGRIELGGGTVISRVSVNKEFEKAILALQHRELISKYFHNAIAVSAALGPGAADELEALFKELDSARDDATIEDLASFAHEFSTPAGITPPPLSSTVMRSGHDPAAVLQTLKSIKENAISPNRRDAEHKQTTDRHTAQGGVEAEQTPSAQQSGQHSNVESVVIGPQVNVFSSDMHSSGHSLPRSTGPQVVDGVRLGGEIFGAVHVFGDQVNVFYDDDKDKPSRPKP